MSETNALIVIRKDDEIVGQAKVNGDGRFKIAIPNQKSDTILTITATDMAGNISEEIQVSVTYTSIFTNSVGN